MSMWPSERLWPRWGGPTESLPDTKRPPRRKDGRKIGRHLMVNLVVLRPGQPEPPHGGGILRHNNLSASLACGERAAG